MIKLIVTDIDGTLLDNSSNLNPEFYTLFEKLKEKQIIFVVASGRQYYNLTDMFNKIKNDIVFIAENGSYMLQNEKELLSITIKKEEAIKLIKIGRKINKADILLCGKESAYIENSSTKLIEIANKYYKKYKIVDDLTNVEDKFLKITIFDLGNAEKNSYNYYKHLENEFKITISGDIWLDISNKKANKGIAVKKLQKINNICYNETMVFGDFLNDYEMLQCGHYSYAMGNAHKKLKEIANFNAKSNNENGVIEAIKELLFVCK